MLSFPYAVSLLWIITLFPRLRVTSFSPYNLTVLEGLSEVPLGWRESLPVPASKTLRFRIALRPLNAFAFEQQVLAISTPDHSLYGRHMGQHEIRQMLQPSSEASDAVLQWLMDEGVLATNIRDEGDWIKFHVTAGEAERILATRFHYYTNAANHVVSIQTLQYSVPEKLHEYIQLVQPTTRFTQIRAQYSTILDTFAIASVENAYSPSGGLDLSLCNTTMTPQCLRNLYNVGDYQGTSAEANKIGIAGFLNQYAKFDDYAGFTQALAPYATKENFTFVMIGYGISLKAAQEDTVANSAEGNLDAQYAFTLAYPAKGIYYSTPGLGPLVPDLDQPDASLYQNEPYLDFLLYMMALPDEDLPTVLSISYGENEQSVPVPYANATCSLFAQLGARGVSVVVSSGDSGAGRACQSNDGTNSTRFSPEFPASCPFVTSVGGTQNVDPEIAFTYSGGGFSDIFCRPSYQDEAIRPYLDQIGNQWKGLYNPEGRGFPDVAAQATNYQVLNRGQYAKVDGTSAGIPSASAPTFAAIISLLNSDRLSSGNPPLGFLNPFLYRVGYKGLTDIIAGGSRGCPGFYVPFVGVESPYVPDAGWNATVGWDPVTGLGTPDFGRLLDLVREWRPRPRWHPSRRHGMRKEER